MRPVDYDSLNRFRAEWLQAKKLGWNTEQLASRLGMTLRQAFQKRRHAERFFGDGLPSLGNNDNIPNLDHQGIKPGRYIIASDLHIWPNVHSRAEDAFVKVLSTHHFDGLILNGDVLDGPAVSRYGKRMAEDIPHIVDEVSNAQARVRDYLKASKNKKITRHLIRGNHDWRLENYLLNNAPAVEGLPGTQLEDIFPEFMISMSANITDRIIIKHRWHAGVHAAYNNAVRSHTAAMITGDTHRLQLTRYSAYGGVTYGVETGFLADRYGPQFSYTENNPQNWCEGFCVLDVEDEEPHIELIDCSRKSPRFMGRPIHGNR